MHRHRTVYNYKTVAWLTLPLPLSLCAFAFVSLSLCLCLCLCVVPLTNLRPAEFSFLLPLHCYTATAHSSTEMLLKAIVAAAYPS